MQSYNNICVPADLKQAINYVNRMPLLEVDVDELQAMYDRVEYFGDPSEECPVCACLRGDVEVYLTTAMDIQEEFETLIDELELLPAGDPRHTGLIAELNNLADRYSKK